MMEMDMNIDSAILLWIQENIRNDFLTPIVRVITHLGDRGMVWVTFALVCLAFPKMRKTGYMVLLSLSGSLLVNNMILKNLTARTRPYEMVEGLNRLIPAPHDFSFPSGHTGSSFAAAVVIFCMCPRKYGVFAMILAVLISLSRLYLGVHYPSDVLAGAVTGTLVALVVVKIFKKKF